MELILYLIFLIVTVLLLYFLYNFKLDNQVIHPSDYILNDFKKFNNKFEHSEKMLKSIGAKDDLINKLKNIREKTCKNIVYGIKNKNNNYRIEIYLYSKNISDFNYNNIDKNKFKNDINIILNEFNQQYTDNIDKLFNTYNIVLISFDLDLKDSSFNNKLHIYEGNDTQFNYNYTYDLNTNKIETESKYFRVFNYDELYKKLLDYKLNHKELIEELKEISLDSKNMMFHYKYYNNSIGIYLMKNNILHLEKFIKKYNYKNLILEDKNKLKDLTFDIVINYDLNENKINGTGFSDYF